MGVHGLWKLLDPVGKPIPVETLENQVLAVDVSIWLHQLMKGFQDSAGSTVPNAHLVGLFHRICKLLFFRIKPVFVFDGGVPTLKKKTIASRNQVKDRAALASEKARQQLLRNLLKQKAVGQVLEDLKAKPGALSSSQRQPDLYELPPIAEEVDDSEDSDEIRECSSSSEDEYKKKKRYKDLHTIDVKSAEFKAMPADIRHDILTDLKETRKQNSWGRIHELPEDMGGFSSYQMNRLLKRRSVQVSLEEAEKEMGGHTLSLADIEVLLTEQGVDTTTTTTVAGRRIASDNVTRYVYANEVLKEGEQQNKESNEAENKGDGKVNDSVKWEDEEEIVIIDDEIVCTGRIKVKTEKDEDILELQEPAMPQIKVEEESDSAESAIFEGVVKEEMELRKQFATDDMGISQEQIMLLIKEQKNLSQSKVEELVRLSLPSTSKERECNQFVKNNDSDLVGEINKNLEKGKSDSFDSVNRVEDKNVALEEKDESSPEKVRVKMLESFETANRMENRNLVVEEKDEYSPRDIRFCNKHKDSKTVEEVGLSDKDVAFTSSAAIVENPQLLTIERSSNKVNLRDEGHENVISSSIIKRSSNNGDVEMTVLEENKEKIQQTNEKSRINRKSLEITVSTKSNVNNEEEDIFADVFSSELNDSGENIANLLEKEAKNDDKGVELMSSETSSSDEEMKDVSGEEDASSADAEEVKSVGKNDENVGEDECRIDDEPLSSQYFRSSESDLMKSTDRSPEATAMNDEHNSEKVSNDEADNSERKKRILSTKELRGLQSILEKQEVELLQVQGREERLATTVTEQMRLEAEELLQLFGLPWIKAPMEAEAQCAFLDLVGLTQGTITDDSDIWLFGAHRVYKNFFNQKKYVLQFRSDDIKSFFKLSRGDLIELALLVGSDYTVGINGIGPVTALEIISTFRPANSSGESILNTLQAFKEWLQHPSNSKTSQLARKLKDVELDEGFPSRDVVDAYLKPCVDDSEEAFSWGSPDVDGLKTYAQRKFGWSQSKVDELLLPVMKSLTQKTNQTRIDTFFNMRPAIPQHKDKVSRRVQRAVERMSGEGSGEEAAEGEEPATSAIGGTRRARDLLAEESESAAGGSRGSRGRKRGGRGGGIREEIRIATQKDRFRSRQPRVRQTATPLVATAGPSAAATSPGVAAPRRSPTKNPATEELIPQRERDRLEGLKRKIQAIQVLKNKKKLKKPKPRAPIKREANLSESSGSSSD